MVPRPKHQAIRETQPAVMEVATAELVAMEGAMVEILEEVVMVVMMAAVG